MSGHSVPNGYVTRFSLESIGAHPDFTTGTFAMSILSSGTDDILPQTGLTQGSTSSQSVTSSSASTIAVTYVAGTSYSSDVYYQTSAQIFTYSKNSNVQVTPDLSWSSSGSTTISYSTASYNGISAPSWITLNSITGQLAILAPDLPTNTDFSFYVSSTITGVTGNINKLVTISVVGSWTASNWQTWSSMSGSTWVTWKSGYSLSSGSWITSTSSASSGTSSPSNQQNSSKYKINDDEGLDLDVEVGEASTTTALILP